MRTPMKHAYIAFVFPLLTACVSVDLPGVVSDTAKVAKDTYKSVADKKGPSDSSKPATEPASSVSNTYIGQDTQTPAEVKQLCASEAAAKLFKASGKEIPYTVTENTISTVGTAMAANCKVTANKMTSPAPTEKP